MQHYRYTVRSFASLCFTAVRNLNIRSLVASFRSIGVLLTAPRSYATLNHHGALVDPFLLLVFSFGASFLRIGLDPNVVTGAETLRIPYTLMIILVAVGSILGALLIPMFWHAVLGIRIDRDEFVGAMVLAYAAVEITWDVLYPFWFCASAHWDFLQCFAAREARTSVPVMLLWMPDTVKTIVVTVYCSLIGASLHKERLLHETDLADSA